MNDNDDAMTTEDAIVHAAVALMSLYEGHPAEHFQSSGEACELRQALRDAVKAHKRAHPHPEQAGPWYLADGQVADVYLFRGEEWRAAICGKKPTQYPQHPRVHAWAIDEHGGLIPVPDLDTWRQLVATNRAIRKLCGHPDMPMLEAVAHVERVVSERDALEAVDHQRAAYKAERDELARQRTELQGKLHTMTVERDDAAERLAKYRDVVDNLKKAVDDLSIIVDEKTTDVRKAVAEGLLQSKALDDMREALNDAGFPMSEEDNHAARIRDLADSRNRLKVDLDDEKAYTEGVLAHRDEMREERDGARAELSDARRKLASAEGRLERIRTLAFDMGNSVTVSEQHWARKIFRAVGGGDVKEQGS